MKSEYFTPELAGGTKRTDRSDTFLTCCRLGESEHEEEPDPDAKRGITYQVLGYAHLH